MNHKFQLFSEERMLQKDRIRADGITGATLRLPATGKREGWLFAVFFPGCYPYILLIAIMSRFSFEGQLSSFLLKHFWMFQSERII